MHLYPASYSSVANKLNLNC